MQQRRFQSHKIQGKKRWLVAASGDRVLPALPSPGKPNLNLPAPAIHNRCSSLPTKQPRNTHDDALIVRKELPVVFPPLLVSLLLVSRDSRCLQQFSVSFLAVDLEMRPEPVRLLTFRAKTASFLSILSTTPLTTLSSITTFTNTPILVSLCLNCPAIFDVFRCGKTLFHCVCIPFSIFSFCERPRRATAHA
jgi:hypothetical protein